LSREEAQSVIALNLTFRLRSLFIFKSGAILLRPDGSQCTEGTLAAVRFYRGNRRQVPSLTLLLAHMTYEFAASPGHCRHFRSMQDFKQPADEFFLAAVLGQISSQGALAASNNFNSFVSLNLQDISIQIIV
jgi:hypothetical protein